MFSRGYSNVENVAQRLLNVKEAGLYLGLSYWTVYRNREIPVVRIGKHKRYKPEDLEKFIEANRECG